MHHGPMSRDEARFGVRRHCVGFPRPVSFVDSYGARMKIIFAFRILLTAVLMSGAAFGQETAISGLDISGAWFNIYQGADSNAAIPLVAYGGYPVNEAGRLYALTW